MTYQFKIQIKGITKPPVWRRVLVPDTFTFQQFHFLIQEVFGWENVHLYSFSEEVYGGSFRISEPDEMDDCYSIPTKDASKVKLRAYFGKDTSKSLVYWYDFGDDWLGMIGCILSNWRLYPMRFSCILVAWLVKGLVRRKIAGAWAAMNI